MGATSSVVQRLRQRIKKRDTWWTEALYGTAKWLLTMDVRPVRLIHGPLHAVFSTVNTVVCHLIRAFYWKPVFLMQVANRPKRLLMFGNGVPYRAGPLHIEMGDDCRLSTQVALIGRVNGAETPCLTIGNNVGIGWSQGIYVGCSITIGDNVRIAGEGSLSGYSGHPYDAAARARGEPDTEEQVKPIVLEDDVWLARGVVVNAGVRIGRGTIVAAGSVVTKDLPAGVLAGGVPARVIRTLPDGVSREEGGALLRAA